MDQQQASIIESAIVLILGGAACLYGYVKSRDKFGLVAAFVCLTYACFAAAALGAAIRIGSAIPAKANPHPLPMQTKSGGEPRQTGPLNEVASGSSGAWEAWGGTKE